MPVRAAAVLSGLLGGAAVAVAAVCPPPAAEADPGIPGGPDTRCAAYGAFNTALACDDPVQPDGTWRRCLTWQPQPVFGVPGVDGGFGGPGSFLPGGSQCLTLGPGLPPPLPGTPPGHIDG